MPHEPGLGSEGDSGGEGKRMRRTRFAVLGALVVVSVVLQAVALLAVAGTATPSFASERAFPGTGAYWEPTVAVDPSSAYLYQAVTYINASKTCSSCPGTAVFL